MSLRALSVDLESIVLNKEPCIALITFFELVLGVVVHSSDKELHIKKMMELDEETQQSLAAMIEAH